MTDQYDEFPLSQPAPAKPMMTSTPSDYWFDNPYLQHLQAGIEGAAHGATMGLNNHLDALLGATGEQISQAYNQYKNSVNPGSAPNTNIPFSKSFTDYLAAARARQSDIQQQNPLSYLGGDIAGSIYTGARALPAASNQVLPNAVNTFAKGVPAMAAQQAIQGGVNNYFASPDTDLSSAAKQAGISGALAGAIGSGTNYLAPIIRNYIQKTGITNNLNKLDALNKDASNDNSFTQSESQQALMKLFKVNTWEEAKNLSTTNINATKNALDPSLRTPNNTPSPNAPTNASISGDTLKVSNVVNPRSATAKFRIFDDNGNPLDVPEMHFIYNENAPPGTGSDLVAAGLSHPKVGLGTGDQFKFTTITNPATVDALNAGVDPASTKMGRLGINAINKMGYEAGDVISSGKNPGAPEFTFNIGPKLSPADQAQADKQLIANMTSGNVAKAIQNAPSPNPTGTNPSTITQTIGNFANPMQHPLGVFGAATGWATNPGDMWDKAKEAALLYGAGWASEMGLNQTSRLMGSNVIGPNMFTSGLGTLLNGVAPATQPIQTQMLTPKGPSPYDEFPLSQ
jgi:hypothetical protein